MKMLNARINFPICTRTTDAFICNFLPRVLYAHELQEVGVHYPKPIKRICSLNYTYKDSQSGGGGGGGIEARPGTEKRCSHNLQSGPVKTWIAVFVIINISDQRSTYSKQFAKFVYSVGGK